MTLYITLHFGSNIEVDVCNVYCRQRSNLDLLPTIENNSGRLLILSGDFNAHHPIIEPWCNLSNPRGRHIAQVVEDFEEVRLHGEALATHTAGGRHDLTLTLNERDHISALCRVPELLSDH